MKKLSALFILIVACFHVHSTPVTSNHSLAIQQGNDVSSTVMIRSNLYALQNDGSTILLDGDMTQYDPLFSNNIDSLDIRKMSNFSENIGMIRGTTILVVERRKTIVNADTIFFKIWQMQQRAYQLQFITMNMQQPGLTGYLEDLYLHTKTPLNLNDSNYINFSINSDPASANPFRFRIIFASTSLSAGILPLTFTSFKAYRQNNNINIEWKTENESNIKKYDIEKSTDGIHFISAFEIAANNGTVNNYQWIDVNPAGDENYYRIRSTEIDGKIAYTQVLKVFATNANSFIRVYPNPVKDNKINLLISNEPAGLYEVHLFNSFGQQVMQKSFKHQGGSSSQPMHAGQNIPKGMYQLEIIKPDGSVLNMGLIF